MYFSVFYCVFHKSNCSYSATFPLLNNALPLHISEDLKHFKKLTLNHPVVMGRKTFESIGKPLEQRKNIVISRNESLNFEGVMIVNSIDKAISIIDKTLEESND